MTIPEKKLSIIREYVEEMNLPASAEEIENSIKQYPCIKIIGDIANYKIKFSQNPDLAIFIPIFAPIVTVLKSMTNADYMANQEVDWQEFLLESVIFFDKACRVYESRDQKRIELLVSCIKNLSYSSELIKKESDGFGLALFFDNLFKDYEIRYAMLAQMGHAVITAQKAMDLLNESEGLYNTPILENIDMMTDNLATATVIIMFNGLNDIFSKRAISKNASKAGSAKASKNYALKEAVIARATTGNFPTANNAAEVIWSEIQSDNSNKYPYCTLTPTRGKTTIYDWIRKSGITFT